MLRQINIAYPEKVCDLINELKSTYKNVIYNIIYSERFGFVVFYEIGKKEQKV